MDESPPPPPMTTVTTTMADTDSPLTLDEKQHQQHEEVKENSTKDSTMSVTIPTRKKKGVKPGTKMNMEKTRSDWYHACKTYRRLRHSRNNNKNNMSQIDFLKDPISGPKFRGTQSEQSSFGKYLRQYDAGQLSASQHGKRAKVARYPDVEARLVDFIHSEYRPDECLWSWTFLQKKALEFAQELGYPDHSFHASNGWICNVLKRGNKTGFELHHLEPEQQDQEDNDHQDNLQEDGSNNKPRHNRQASRLVATLIASQRQQQQQQTPSVVVPGETTTSPMPSLSGDDDDDDDDVDDEDQLLLREALATATKQSSPPMHSHHHDNDDNDDTHKTSPILIKPWRCICNEENDAELNYCGMCGTPQRWQCLTCQFSNNRARFKFCGMCGILKQPTQPQQQHQQLAPPPPVGGV